MTRTSPIPLPEVVAFAERLYQAVSLEVCNPMPPDDSPSPFRDVAILTKPSEQGLLNIINAEVELWKPKLLERYAGGAETVEEVRKAAYDNVCMLATATFNRGKANLRKGTIAEKVEHAVVLPAALGFFGLDMYLGLNLAVSGLAAGFGGIFTGFLGRVASPYVLTQFGMGVTENIGHELGAEAFTLGICKAVYPDYHNNGPFNPLLGH